jgi:hypothetical protein
MKPSYALEMVKGEFETRHAALITEYLSMASQTNNDSDKKLRQYGKTSIYPEVLAIAQELVGPIDNDTLHHRAFDWLIVHMKDDKRAGLDRWVSDLAQAQGLKISHVDVTEPERDVSEYQLESLSVKDLNQSLVAMNRLLDRRQIAAQFWTKFAARYLVDVLEQDYFKKRPADYGRIYYALSKYGNVQALPGEEVYQSRDASRHKHWVSFLLEKISAGGAFIAVGAAHVIPKLDPAPKHPQIISDGRTS